MMRLAKVNFIYLFLSPTKFSLFVNFYIVMANNNIYIFSYRNLVLLITYNIIIMVHMENIIHIQQELYIYIYIYIHSEITYR